MSALKPFPLLPIIFVILGSCVSNSTPIQSVKQNEIKSQSALAEKKSSQIKFMPNLLNDLALASTQKTLSAISKSKEKLEARHSFKTLDIKEVIDRASNITGTKEGKSSLIGQSSQENLGIKKIDLNNFAMTTMLLVAAFNDLSEQNFLEAERSAFAILLLEGQTFVVYKKAIQIIFLAESFLKKELFVGEYSGISLNWETDLCKLFCDTPAWAILTTDKGLEYVELEEARENLLNKESYDGYGLPYTEFTYVPKVKEKKTPGDIRSEFSSIESWISAVKEKRWTMIKKNAPSVSKLNIKCDAVYIYSRYALANANRYTQNRSAFKTEQSNFLAELKNSNCGFGDFRFSSDTEYLSFLNKEKLWMSRLFWENSELTQALALSKEVLAYGEKAGQKDIILESVQIILGRLLIEMYDLPTAFEYAKKLRISLGKYQDLELEKYTSKRVGLLAYAAGEFAESVTFLKFFLNLSDKPSESAFVHYWLGRAYKALAEKDPLKKSLISAGEAEPLGFYDALAGQISQMPSGHISSSLRSPFARGWKVEMEKWWPQEANQSWERWVETSQLFLALFERDTKKTNHENFGQIKNSVDYSIFLAAVLRLAQENSDLQEFSNFLAESKMVEVLLLRENVLSLGSKEIKLDSSKEGEVDVSVIAWLQFITANYVGAIQFVGKFQTEFLKNPQDKSFLFFLFYPRPFQKEFSLAEKQCGVDKDLLYAIARQESLFQRKIKSPVGAIGLLQLMPATAKRILQKNPTFAGKDLDLTDVGTNLTAGACYLRDLIDRYNGNLFFAVAAYNAGEQHVDEWVKRRKPIEDIPYFIEWIPFSETNTYVKKVFRNYYNIKWIYKE